MLPTRICWHWPVVWFPSVFWKRCKVTRPKDLFLVRFTMRPEVFYDSWLMKSHVRNGHRGYRICRRTDNSAFFPGRLYTTNNFIKGWSLLTMAPCLLLASSGSPTFNWLTLSTNASLKRSYMESSINKISQKTDLPWLPERGSDDGRHHFSQSASAKWSWGFCPQFKGDNFETGGQWSYPGSGPCASGEWDGLDQRMFTMASPQWVRYHERYSAHRLVIPPPGRSAPVKSGHQGDLGGFGHHTIAAASAGRFSQVNR